MQYSLRWKNKLNINITDRKMPLSLIYNYDLEKDLDRTFPTNDFFKKNKHILKNIILNYIEINSAIDYFQGLCYITYTMYYAFKDSECPEYNTFYAIHKFIAPIRPIIPIDDQDIEPILFIDNISKLILLNIFHKKNELGKKLKELNIIKIFVVSGLPALFANWYTLEEILLLWDYFLDSSASKMMDNIINFLTYFFIYNEKIILHLNFESVLSLLQERQGLSNIIFMLKYKK
jgi:hypothetical protein